MKKFESHKELYSKIVSLQEDIVIALDDYIREESIGLNNYREKLFVQFNEVADKIFEKLISGESDGMNYLIDNMENDLGDAQIITGFLRAYITEKIIEEVVYFENLEELAM